MLSVNKMPPEQLGALYNLADCTINISDAEGFGLATFESLSCGTPIIVNMTGGLQEQVTDGNEFFGIPIFPSSKSIIGSQDVPYIYEDRISKGDFHNALDKIIAVGPDGRRKMGYKGRQYILDKYNFDNFSKKWLDVMNEIHETHGSWENRKNYAGIRFKEVA